MVEQLNIQSLVDIGFVALVTFACIRSLLSDSTGSERRREHWQNELKALEQTLRSLISEAGAASSNLDRSLLQRKRELEQLLKKLDGRQDEPAPARQTPKRPAAARPPELTLDDVPNETWIQPRSRAAAAAKQERPQTGNEFVLGTELEQLVEAADDTVSLTNQVMAEAVRSAAKPVQSRPSTLSEEIELIRSDPAESETFARTSILDPTTYRIARRLLQEGKEIHVVARKLELPVSEVRNLDRLIRQESQRTLPKAEFSGPLVNAEPAAAPRPAPARRIARDSSSWDQDIQRETALL